MPDSARAFSRAALFLPVLCALAVHSRSLGHGFMSDDGVLILENRQITEAGHLGRVLTTDWFDNERGGSIGYYRPVTKLSLRLTWALAGPGPFWFHLGNVVAHAVAVLALAYLLLSLAGPVPALLGASVFAVHPMTVQAIDIVTARSDVYAALFSLAACASLIRFRESGRASWLVGVSVSSLLAFGSKESALLLPVILLALGVAAGLSRRALLAAVVPVLSCEVVMFALRAYAVRVAPLPNSLAALPWRDKVLAILSAVGTYAMSLAVGTPIVRLPQLPTRFFEPRVLFGSLVLLGAFLVVLSLRRTSIAGFAVVLIGASLAPVLAVWVIHIPRWYREVPVAERWLYFPCAGVGFLWGLLAARFRTRAVVAGVACVAVVLAALSIDRSAMYASQDAMARYVEGRYVGADETQMNPRERYFARTMRAAQLFREGRIADALGFLYEADAIAPAIPTHLPVIAQAELDLGRSERAVAALERLLSPAFATNPEAVRQRAAFGSDAMERFDRVPIEYLLGRAYGAAKRSDESLEAFAAAARDARGRRDEAEYIVDWALALRDAGRRDEARNALQRAAALRPAWSRPLLDLAILDLREGHAEEARRQLREVLHRGGPEAARARELLREAR